MARATEIYAFLVEPLPYEQPDRLVMVWETDRTTGEAKVPTQRLLLGGLSRSLLLFRHLLELDYLVLAHTTTYYALAY